MFVLFTRYPFLKTYLLPLSIGLIGFVLIIVGIAITFVPKKEDISFSTQNTVGDGFKPFPSITNPPAIQITVDIEGSVVKPGVYHLLSDARVKDALNASGGISSDADRDYVEKKINLAAKLSDGAKLYIPHNGELPISNVQFQMSNNDSSQQTLGSATGPININDATADQLDALQGVGPVTAQKIINGRPYSDIQDLLTKKIVSSKVFGEIKDKITVN